MVENLDFIKQEKHVYLKIVHNLALEKAGHIIIYKNAKVMKLVQQKLIQTLEILLKNTILMKVRYLINGFVIRIGTKLNGNNLLKATILLKPLFAVSYAVTHLTRN